MSGLFGILQPKLPLLLLPCIRCLLQFSDQIIQIWWLLFIVIVTSSQAKVFIILYDVCSLLVSEEKCIWEEYFTAGEHFFFRVFLWFRYQLMDQHIKGHVRIAFIELLALDHFILKFATVFNLGFTSGTASLDIFDMNFSFKSRVIDVVIILLGDFTLCILVLMFATVATFEERSSLDITKEFFFFLYILLFGFLFFLLVESDAPFKFAFLLLRFQYTCAAPVV